MNGKTVGIIGTGAIGHLCDSLTSAGKIGVLVAKALQNGFGCNILAYDVYQRYCEIFTTECIRVRVCSSRWISDEVKAMGIAYKSLDEVLAASDIISLHVPLLPTTKHMVQSFAIFTLMSGSDQCRSSREDEEGRNAH